MEIKMVQDYIVKKYPQYKDLSEEDKCLFFASIKESDYEDFRSQLGQTIFERDDFDDWECDLFYEFYTHPKFNEFAIICSEWLGVGKNNFYLADNKFTCHSRLFETDFETYETQKKHCPQLINYRPFYFETLYSCVVKNDNKPYVVDGAISSFQNLFFHLMIEFTSKYRKTLKAPEWLKSEKEKEHFIDISFIELRESFLYKCIADANEEFSTYFLSNPFIFLDKGTNIYKKEQTSWNIYISSEEHLKCIRHETFWEDIEKFNLVEEIPNDFIHFFSDVIKSCSLKIKNKFDEIIDVNSKNQLGTLSRIKKHKPIQVVFLKEVIKDFENIAKLEKIINDTEKEIASKSKLNIKILNNKFKLFIFNDVFCEDISKIELFKVNVVKYLIENKPEIFKPFV